MLKSIDPSPSIQLAEGGRVGVAQLLGEFAVLAAVPIRTGELVFRIEGMQVGNPSRFSVQIDERWHVDLAHGASESEIIRNHPWRFMNHSCNPSVRIVGREVRALRPVLPGDEITFDYDTTEMEMAEPFDCRCGSEECRGWIGGFVHLEPTHRERLRRLLAPYLLQRIAQWDGAGAKA
jgi:hypothetical protein